MSLSRKTAVAGVFEHPTRFAPDKSLFQIMGESVRGALDDAGLTIKDVNGLCTTGIGMSGMGIVGFCDYLNLTPNFVDSTSIGGSSFVAHTAHAAAAIHAGLCDVCLVVYGSTAASSRFAIGTGGGGGGGSGDEMIRDASTSSTVIGSRYFAAGFIDACRRIVTAISASCSEVVP